MYDNDNNYVNNQNQSLPEIPKSPQNSGDPQGSGNIGFAITSMVLGILSLLFVCIYYISPILSILGIIFASISLKKKCKGKGMAIAGLVTSIISLSLLIIVIILGIIGITAMLGSGFLY